MTRRVALASILVFLAGLALAGPREKVEEAKLLYEQKKFSDAEKRLSEAAADISSANPNRPLLDFNQAATFYKRQDFDKAIGLYEKSLLTKDLQLEATAKYNLGNCYFQQALKNQTDLGKAIELLDKAMSYYRDAMETLAQPDDARYNLEKSKLLKKDLIDKKKKEQDEQKKDQGKDDKKDQQDKKDEKKDNQKTSGDDKKQDEKDKQQAKQGKDDKKQEMSPENAEKLLNAIREKQQQNEREERVRQPAGYMPVERDW